LPTRSGVSEPGATVQGWDGDPAQGWRWRRSRHHRP
jgi:hypothetical protein